MFNRLSSAAIIALISSSTCLSPLSVAAEETQQMSSFEQKGAANLPASVLAILGKEGGGYTGISPHDTTFTSEANITRMLDGMEVANSRYYSEKQGLKDIQTKHNQLQLGLRLSAIILDTKVTSAVIEVTSFAISEGVNSVIEDSSQYYSKQYDMSIKNVVDLAVTRSSDGLINKWDGAVTKETAGQAMSEIFGEQVDFFNRFALSDMSPEAKQEITNAKADMLASAIARVKAMSDVQRAADKTELEGKITAQAGQIKKIANDVTVFRKQWKEQLTALQATQAASAASLKAELVDVKSDVDAIQKQMWRGMGPRERLAALQDGFLKSMDPVDREDTIKKLTTSVQIMDKRDEALKVLGYAGEIGGLLVKVGLPIDIANFQKNINTANIGVNLVSDLALGNWIGAARGAASLFGGDSGPDASEERHRQIMQALGQIVEMQKQTLKALEAISKQIADSTNLMMSKLDKMDRKLDLIVDLSKHTIFKDGAACGEFIRRAQADGMVGGVFPSYEVRRTSFNQDIDSGYTHYSTCKNFINVYKNVNEPSALNEGKITPLIFREEMVPDAKTERLSPQLNRMLQLTTEYAQASGSSQCIDRMLAYLADAPRTFSVAKLDEFVCTKDKAVAGTPITAVNPDRKLVSQNGRTIEGYEALSDAVSAGVVRTVGNYVLFFAPYNALLSGAKLATLEELAARSDRPKNVNDDAILWPKHYQDLINISLAQQTVLSGVYALPLAEKILLDNGFGHSVTSTMLSTDQVKAHKCSYPENATPPDKATYQTVACLLGENPWFLSNLSRNMVTKALRKSGATLSRYEFALQSNDGTNISKLLGDIPVKWVTPDKDRRSPWVIDLMDAAGNSWDVPLPTTVEIRSNAVTYRPVADELFKLRKAFQDRIVLQDDNVQAIANEAAGGFLLRRALMSSPTLLSVNLN